MIFFREFYAVSRFNLGTWQASYLWISSCMCTALSTRNKYLPTAYIKIQDENVPKLQAHSHSTRGSCNSASPLETLIAHVQHLMNSRKYRVSCISFSPYARRLFTYSTQTPISSVSSNILAKSATVTFLSSTTSAS